VSETIDLSHQDIKDAIAAAVAEETKGLKSKNDELLGKIKKLQQGQTITPEELAAVEAERDDWKAKANEATKAATKAAKDAEAAAKRAADNEAAMSRLVVDNGLSDALIKAGVTNPVHQKAAKALLREQVALADENGSKVAKVGDKALSDYITEWAGSDEGKHFVTAPDTSGGGSRGGRATPGKQTITRAQFDAMDHYGRVEFAKAGGSVTD
jgi:chromosome segregation ATPase